MEKILLQAIVYGHVQGVGFRWTVQEKAEKLQLVGSVKNLKNGSVEIFLEGPQELLKVFLNDLMNNCGNAKIDKIATIYQSKLKHFDKFSIIF